MIHIENIRKVYPVARKKERLILDGISLEVKSGQSIAIRGRSGSGKTTLLNILAGLDGNYEGTYFFEGENITRSSSTFRAKFRKEKLGIITQRFDLLDDRNVYENIALSLRGKKISGADKKKLVDEILSYVGLDGHSTKSIKQLSGGEMQRVAIARALVKNPRLIIADEPTGSLDEKTRDDILDLFQKMMEDGRQFIIVTHDERVSAICNREFHLQNSLLVESQISK